MKIVICCNIGYSGSIGSKQLLQFNGKKVKHKDFADFMFKTPMYQVQSLTFFVT